MEILGTILSPPAGEKALTTMAIGNSSPATYKLKCIIVYDKMAVREAEVGKAALQYVRKFVHARACTH